MKRLVLIRHAKTEQTGYDQDFQRELTDRGVADAHNIVSDLKKWKIIPDKINTSPAVRALETARIFAKDMALPMRNVVEVSGLYFDYTTQDFLNMIQQTEDQVDTLFVFGHNPFMYHLAMNMSKMYDGHMPTCSTVVLDFNVDSWVKVEPYQGTLFLHLYPKLLK